MLEQKTEDNPSFFIYLYMYRLIYIHECTKSYIYICACIDKPPPSPTPPFAKLTAGLEVLCRGRFWVTADYAECPDFTDLACHDPILDIQKVRIEASLET